MALGRVAIDYIAFFGSKVSPYVLTVEYAIFRCCCPMSTTLARDQNILHVTSEVVLCSRSYFDWWRCIVVAVLIASSGLIQGSFCSQHDTHSAVRQF